MLKIKISGNQLEQNIIIMKKMDFILLQFVVIIIEII